MELINNDQNRIRELRDRIQKCYDHWTIEAKSIHIGFFTSEGTMDYLEIVLSRRDRLGEMLSCLNRAVGDSCSIVVAADDYLFLDELEEIVETQNISRSCN